MGFPALTIRPLAELTAVSDSFAAPLGFQVTLMTWDSKSLLFVLSLIMMQQWACASDETRAPGPTASDSASAHAGKQMYNGLPAAEAAKAMTLPDGFKVIPCASEPDVKQPIAMTIDDRG